MRHTRQGLSHPDVWCDILDAPLRCDLTCAMTSVHAENQPSYDHLAAAGIRTPPSAACRKVVMAAVATRIAHNGPQAPATVIAAKYLRSVCETAHSTVPRQPSRSKMPHAVVWCPGVTV
jgi:hypothetical protein